MKFIQADSSNYTKGRTKAIDHIIIHYTGNDGDTAKGNCNYFAQANRNASAHYFVDENGIVQSVKETDVAWHSGKWTMNCRSIGIEMCSRKDSSGNYYIKEETQKKAAQLASELMAKYNIGIENVIRHYDVTGKNCPEPFVRKLEQWTAFKNRVLDYSKEDEGMVETSKMIINGKEVEVKRILKDGTNYIAIRDIADALGYKISSNGNVAVLSK